MRVPVAGGSKRGLVAVVDGDSVEVLVGDEDLVVSASDVRPLEAFEKGTPAAGDPLAEAAECKARGNKLYELRDWEAAAEQYSAGIALLTPAVVGSLLCFYR